jgi:Flp pilus assembly pilin Flp
MNTPHTSIQPSDEVGQTMAEYGVMLALITITVAASAALLGNSISGVLTRIASFLGA